MPIEERLEKLERQLTRTKRQNRCLLLALVLVGTMVVACGGSGGGDSVTESDSATDTVQAREFVVVDEQGTRHALLHVDQDGPGLVLFDENSNPRVGLAVLKGGTALILSDENGKPRAGMVLPENGPMFGLHDTEGKLFWSAP